GRGRAPHPGAAPHGVGVQTGSNGKGRGRAERPTRVRRLARRGFKQAATGGAGPGRRSPSRAARPTGGRVLYAGLKRGRVGLGRGGGGGGGGAGGRSPARGAAPEGGRCLFGGVQGGGGGGGAGPARLAVAADDVYQRVAPPQRPAPSAGHPAWPNRALPEERK